MKTQSLPRFFKPLLWSYNFEDIDPEKSKQTIIVNSINYGDLRHWQWIKKAYGEKEIQKVLHTIPITALRPRAAKLAQLIFKAKFNYAPRGPHKREGKDFLKT